MYRYGANLNRRSLRSRAKTFIKKRSQLVLALLATVTLLSPMGALAKGGADNVPAGPAYYSVLTKGVNFSGNTMTLDGSLTINNFVGREDEQYIKFNWGDGTQETDKVMNLSTYLKSSKLLTVTNFSRSHTYTGSTSWLVSVRIYQGNSYGVEVNGAPFSQYSFQTENTLSVCGDGSDNDRDGTKDLYDNDCAKFRSTENSTALCSDGIDNDISGKTDLYDPNCAAFIPKEDTIAACADGIDNDLDGRVDLRDADCAAFVPKEDAAAVCSDGIDNDLDGKVDLYDADCASFRPAENAPGVCTDGIDNDFDGLVDGQDPDCAGQTPLENTAAVCLDGIDNDFDGKFDWLDNDCADFVIPANCPVGFVEFFFPGFGFICAASAGY